MPSNSSGKEIALEREQRIWDLRQQGWSQRRIAQELDIDQATVSRALARVNRRELKRLSNKVEHFKLESTNILEHIRDESLQAWERSKRPKTRATQRDGGGGKGGGKTTVTEATEREGEPAHLDRALAADREIRRIWGVDAPPAKPKEDDASGVSVSAIAQRLKANAERYEANQRDLDGPSDRGGGEQVSE